MSDQITDKEANAISAKESRFDTFSLPQIIFSSDQPEARRRQPRTCVRAKDVPLRVLVRVFGEGGTAYLAFDANSLQQPRQRANTFRMDAGDHDSIIVMPGQILYAASDSDAMTMSIAVSPAPVLAL